MTKSNPNTPPIIYQTKEGALEIKQDIENKTIWASQKQITEKIF